MLDFRLELSKFQRESLEKSLKENLSKGKLTIVNRIRSILAIGDHADIPLIARILRVNPETIRGWLSRYLCDGIRGLLKMTKQPGRPSNLTKTQKKQLRKWLIEGPPSVGFPGACWRTPMIQRLILEKFGVLYNVKYLSEFLKNLGFSYQKACFGVGGKNPENSEKRRQWLETTAPEALRIASEKNGYLLFGDEASFPQWGSLTYTWALIGEEPIIPTSGIRKGYKVFGLIDYFSGKFFYKTLESRFNSESYKAFLWDILKTTRKHIVLIQDGAPYHTSKATRLFFEQFKHRLTVFQLPSYSPDFNPIEKLWKNIKTDEIHLHYFPTFEDLKKKVEGALKRFSKKNEDIKQLFNFYNEREVA